MLIFFFVAHATTSAQHGADHHEGEAQDGQDGPYTGPNHAPATEQAEREDGVDDVDGVRVEPAIASIGLCRQVDVDFVHQALHLVAEPYAARLRDLVVGGRGHLGHGSVIIPRGLAATYKPFLGYKTSLQPLVPTCTTRAFLNANVVVLY